MGLIAADSTPMKINLPYLVADTDRHGNIRYYVRRKGQPKIRIRAEPSSETFRELYAAAIGGKIVPKPKIGVAVDGSFRWLCQEYFKSAAYRQLGERTQYVRRSLLERVCQSKTPLGKERANAPVALMQERHVREIRDELADKPGAANNVLKALRGLFLWAKEAGLTTSNPARDVKRFGSGVGWHTWTDEEISRFEKAHPIGSKARLAFALFRYVGVRISDVVKLGPGMEMIATDEEGNEYEALRFRVTKGSQRKPQPGKPAAEAKWLVVPLLPELREILDASEIGGTTYLVTEFDTPYTIKGLGNWFRRRCDDAGLEHCSAHGIRKYGATRAAEMGASEYQLMGIFGWDDPKQAATYTRKARQRKLARASMHLLSSSSTNTKSEKVSHRPTKVSHRKKKQ